MKLMKIRRVGNSNVVSLPHELEERGYTAGASVIIEELPSGELRIIPAPELRRIVREIGREVIAENREALSRLAAHDGPVAGPSTSSREVGS